MKTLKLLMLLACFFKPLCSAAVEPGSADYASGPYYFVAVHNEPHHRPGGETLLADSYHILRRMVTKADRYNIRLTLMFSPQWADHIAASEDRLREVAGWKATGHEIAGHHHSIQHGNWDGYTNFTRQEAETARLRRGQKPEEYRGTLADFMESLRRLDPEVDCGCMNDEGNKRALPDDVVVDTCSGFANFGQPGRSVSDTLPEKGKNEYISVGEANGIDRKWLCHAQTTTPQRAQGAMKVFAGMESGVYGSVNHSSAWEQASFDAWLDFLHEQDPKGAKSRTVSEVIEEKLLPEKTIAKDLLETQQPEAVPANLKAEILRYVRILKELLDKRKAEGVNVSRAEVLDWKSREAMRHQHPEECLKLLKEAVEILETSKSKEQATLPADRQFTISDQDRARIEAAIPRVAAVRPAVGRRLLIFDVNVGYPGHPSRFYANLALQRMGEVTGAFETVVSRDPAVFQPESLRRFDAVFLNNTVGNLFEDPALRQSLLEFVYGGGGLLGVHGTSVAFTRWPGAKEDWPEFGTMLGGRGARHREPDEHVFVKLDSPGHPLVETFPAGGFDYRDEFFRVGDPYSRDRVRVLLSIDTEKTDLTPKDPRWRQERADNDYALAWVRNYGRGRIFYSTIAHNPSVFWDREMLEFYLRAVQFGLGDLSAPTTPSSKLTPAVLAQEKLGRRLGITAYTFHKYTLFEAIDKTAELGLGYIGGLSFQKVSGEVPKNFDAALSDDELKQIRLTLDSAGVRLLTHYYAQIPGDEEGCRRVFEFGRKMGVEAFISEPPPESLDTIEQFCDEYDIRLAIHNHGPEASPHYWSPEKLADVCRGRSSRIGACPDLGYWMRSGVDPIEGLRTLGDRVVTLQIHDLDQLTAEGHDVPWGTGACRLEQFLSETHRLGVKPVMFGLEYSYDWLDSMPELAASVEFFNSAGLKLVDAKP